MLDISEKLRIFLARRADDMNDGVIPGDEVIRAIGEEGWLRLGVPSRLGGTGGSLTEAIEAIAEVSELCLTSGFLFWCHRMFIEYLVHSDNVWLQGHLLSRLLSGDLHGATGLSNAVKHLAGIEPLRLQAERQAGAVTLQGALAWVSNLSSDGFVVAVAASTGGNSWSILAVPSSADGVEAGKELSLLGLGSSLTAPIRFDRVSLPAEWVIHEQGDVFLRRVRSRFILLQVGMSLGLARRALKEAGSAGLTLTRRLAIRVGEAVARLRDLETTVHEYGFAESVDPDHVPHLFELRIALADVALQAVWLELQAKGGRAYLKSCGTGRRLREAAFLPVVSPTCVQLERELELHRVSARA